MDNKDALRWGAIYFVASTVAGLVGLGLVAAGVAVVDTPLADLYRQLFVAPGRFVANAAPGLVLGLLGVIVWRLGRTAAFYRTLVSAVEAETAEKLDTETLKSDILSVLDDRLSDMHGEMTRTRREIDRATGESTSFEFDDG